MNKTNLLIGTALLTIIFYIAKIFEPFFVWHIPLSPVRIPVIYWAAFLAYSFLFFRIMRTRWNGMIACAISCGIVLDLLYAFIQSEAYRAMAGYSFEAGIYKAYYLAIYYLGVAATCFTLAYLIRGVFFSKYNRTERSDYIFMPFAAVFLVSLIQLWKTNFTVCVVFLTLTALFALLPGLEKISSSIRKAYSALLNWAYDHEKVMLVLFFIAAIAVRGAYLLRTMSQPDYVATGADGALFDSHAWKIASGQPVSQAYTAGYFIFLAGLYKIFGHNYFAACFVQVILGAFVCLFIYDIIKQLTGNKGVAYLGLFLATVNYSLVFSSISIGHQALDCFLLSFIAVLFVHYLKGASTRISLFLIAIAALASGYAVAARESDLFVIAVLPLFILAHRIKTKNIRTGIMESIIFVILFIVPIVPFLMRNVHNLGVLYPVKYSDTALFPAEHTFSPEGSGNQKLIALGINPFTDPKESIRAFLMRPAPAVAALAESITAKFTSLFMDQTYGTFDMLFLIRRSWFYCAAWLYAFFITVYGIIYMLGYRRPNGRTMIYLILTFIFLKTLPHLLISSRFGLRPPIDLFLIIAFSIGAMKLFSINGKDTIYQR